MVHPRGICNVRIGGRVYTIECKDAGEKTCAARQAIKITITITIKKEPGFTN